MLPCRKDFQQEQQQWVRSLCSYFNCIIPCRAVEEDLSKEVFSEVLLLHGQLLSLVERSRVLKPSAYNCKAENHQ